MATKLPKLSTEQKEKAARDLLLEVEQEKILKSAEVKVKALRTEAKQEAKVVALDYQIVEIQRQKDALLPPAPRSAPVVTTAPLAPVVTPVTPAPVVTTAQAPVSTKKTIGQKLSEGLGDFFSAVRP